MYLLQDERLRFLGPKCCSNCGQVIKRNDYFHRCSPNYTYHVQCFKCQFCHSALNKGDRYLCLEGQLLCERDFQRHHMPVPECGITDSQREVASRKTGKSAHYIYSPFTRQAQRILRFTTWHGCPVSTPSACVRDKRSRGPPGARSWC